MTDDDIELIAQRVVELLEDRQAMPAMVTARELAEYLGVSRDVIYDNAERLGVIRLGDGPKARLRFPLDPVALRSWQRQQSPSQPPPKPAKRRRHRARPDVELIEYERGG